MRIETATVMIPPLNFAAFRALQSLLVRNYPEVARYWLKENLDLRNMKTIFQAVMGVSGLQQKGEVPPMKN